MDSAPGKVFRDSDASSGGLMSHGSLREWHLSVWRARGPSPALNSHREWVVAPWYRSASCDPGEAWRAVQVTARYVHLERGEWGLRKVGFLQLKAYVLCPCPWSEGPMFLREHLGIGAGECLARAFNLTASARKVQNGDNAKHVRSTAMPP